MAELKGVGMVVKMATVAVPISMSHPEIAEDAPVWLDAGGNEYRIVSGYIEVSGDTPNATPSPERSCVIVGLPGLDALHSMGLHPKQTEEESAE